MSARVYNPLFLSEMRRMLRGGGVAGGAGSAASAAATAGCGGEAAAASSGGGGGYSPPPPPVAGLDRVRRQLFGPVDHEETRRFVQDELQAMRRRDTEHYGFDFEREAPLPGSRLVWEKVQPEAAVPASYALRRLPYLATHADAATAVAAASVAEAAADGDDAPRGTEEKAVQTASPAPFAVSATSAETTPVAAAPALAKASNNNNNNNSVSTPKQTCISDFMKSRKRTSGPTGTKPNKIAQEGPSVKQAKKTHS
ncbi:cyclin-dependent kinase inhibitor 1-like [Schistocerca serialis cubense]|uniref:cyclin-dependent kinase inhibitor 1-like n=1 Tax=Schistocerca serialis cubense TaxID=2023355 RepID=UPI00214F4AF7|nr:cyclin-dependent kinase inhibitor 1-like [Schistocerca serialis cubense]